MWKLATPCRTYRAIYGRRRLRRWYEFLVIALDVWIAVATVLGGSGLGSSRKEDSEVSGSVSSPSG